MKKWVIITCRHWIIFISKPRRIRMKMRKWLFLFSLHNLLRLREWKSSNQHSQAIQSKLQSVIPALQLFITRFQKVDFSENLDQLIKPQLLIIQNSLFIDQLCRFITFSIITRKRLRLRFYGASLSKESYKLQYKLNGSRFVMQLSI